LLNGANVMIEELQKQKMDLERHTVDRDRVYAEYEEILDWCRQVRSERSELSYQQKRDFLYMLGATVLVSKQEHWGAEPTWDIRVALPKVQEIIYQGTDGAIGGSLSRDRRRPAFPQRFSLNAR